MTAASPARPPLTRRFTFDLDFGEVAARPGDAPAVPTFSAEALEAARAAAYAEGQASAIARAEAAQAAALADLARVARAALDALTAVAHDHRAGCAGLALAAGRAIAGAALDRFPEAAAEAALEALAREVEASPRLTLSTAPADRERAQAALGPVAERIGYPGALTVRADGRLAPAAFVLDWGDGRAAFDPAAASARVAQALAAALAAEGLHAEPLHLELAP